MTCEARLDKLAELIYAKTGIVFHGAKRQWLLSRVQRFLQHHALECEGFLNRIERDGDFFERAFFPYISVGETYFFREVKPVLAAIKSLSFDGLGRQYPLNVLSVPCSTGEEVYSTAILLECMGLTNYRIVGMDLNHQALDKSRQGCYPPSAFRYVAAPVEDCRVEGYFHHRDDGVRCVKQVLKDKVRFVEGNVLSPSITERFDMILCRNLFIYFDERSKRQAMDALNRLLNPGGQIILGHAD